MQQAINQFRISINRVRDLIALHNSVQSQSTAVLDLSDMWVRGTGCLFSLSYRQCRVRNGLGDSPTFLRGGIVVTVAKWGSGVIALRDRA